MRASSGTITGGAIPPSPRFSFGLSSRGRVARRTWEERASLVTYSAKGGQRIKSGPRHLSLLLWDAVPCRVSVALEIMFPLRLFCNWWRIILKACSRGWLWICLFRCSGVTREVSDLSRGARYFLPLLRFFCRALTSWGCLLGVFFIPPSFANKSLYRGSWSKKKKRSNVYNNHHAPSALISRIELALVLY